MEILNTEEDYMVLNVEAPLDEWEGWMATDDVKGGELPPGLVHSARLKRLSTYKIAKCMPTVRLPNACRKLERNHYALSG